MEGGKRTKGKEKMRKLRRQGGMKESAPVSLIPAYATGF